MALAILPSVVPAAAPTVDLVDWRAPAEGDGWSAKRLRDVEVRDAQGTPVGKVGDVLVGADERVSAIVLELGSDAVPDGAMRLAWDEIDSVGEIGPLWFVALPLSASELEAYAGEDVALEDREWRTSDLIGDTVSLVDSPAGRQGAVEDLIFGIDGGLDAIVASGVPGTEGQTARLPFFGYEYGFEPALDDYILPYTVAEVAGRSDASAGTVQASPSDGADGDPDAGPSDGNGERITLVSEPEKVATLEGTDTDTEGGTDAETGSGGTTEASLDAEALFAFDSSELKLGAEQAVVDLLVSLEDASDIERIEVTGHTDSVGPEDYNLTLSRERAEAVAELVRADFPDIDVVASGAGETEPQASNDTDKGRQLNRRVDVTVVRG